MIIREALIRSKKVLESAVYHMQMKDCIASIIISVICLLYTIMIGKKWDFESHKKFGNFFITGATNKRQFNQLAKIVNVYNIICIAIETPIAAYKMLNAK